MAPVAVLLRIATVSAAALALAFSPASRAEDDTVPPPSTWVLPAVPSEEADYYDTLRVQSAEPDVYPIRTNTPNGTTTTTGGGGVNTDGSAGRDDDDSVSHVIEFVVPIGYDPSTGQGSGSGGGGGGDDEEEAYRLCELTTLLPYTYSNTTATTTGGGGGGGGGENGGSGSNGGGGVVRSRVHEDAAAVLVAVHLFNNANSNGDYSAVLDRIVSVPPPPPSNDDNQQPVVPVSELLAECNFRFTADFVNTFSSPIQSTNALTAIFQSEHTPRNAQPCSVLGPYSSMVTSPTAILSSVKTTPHVSYAASSTDFDNKEQYPKFARLCTNTVADATAVLSYLQTLGVHNLGMIFVTDSFGSSMAKSVQDLASSTSYNITVNPVSISYDSYTPGRNTEIVNAVRHLKNTRYRYFLGVMMDVHYEAVMKEASREGIVGQNAEDGGNYVWILSGVDAEMMRTMVGGYQMGTTMADATTGIGILRLAADKGDSSHHGTEGDHPEEDDTSPTTTTTASSSYHNFAKYYGQLMSDPTFRSYVASKQSDNVDDVNDLEFRRDPTEWGHFLFDSVLGLGLAACNASSPVPNDPTSDKAYFVNGDTLYDEFVGMTYRGASGLVDLDPDTGTRSSDTVTYEILNIVPTHLLQEERGLRRSLQEDEGEEEATSSTTANFQIVVSAVYAADPEEESATGEEEGEGSSSSSSSWTEVRPFVYSDGTTDVPAPLPPPELEPNYIGRPSRIAGLVLAILIILLSIGFAIWSLVLRRHRIVRSSNPRFLTLVCFGCVVMASAIVPLGMEETVLSKEGLDKACVAFPWLFVVGFAIMFSPVFAKTLQLFRVHRNQGDVIAVTAKDLLLSLLFFTVINVALLLSWTLTAPLEWNREYFPSKDQFDREIESYGTCTVASDEKRGTALAFVVVLIVFNLAALLTANILGYQARSIKTEYRESHYMAIAMASILQAWCLGIPIMIVVFQTPQAKFWVETGIIFVTSTATLLLIFVPKLIAYRKERIKEAQERVRQSQRVRERRRSNEEEFEADMDTPVTPRSDLKGSVFIRPSSLNSVGAVDVDLEKQKANAEQPKKDTITKPETEDSVANGGIKVIQNTTSSTVDNQATAELRTKLAEAQEKNTRLLEENERIERELKELKSNTATQ